MYGKLSDMLSFKDHENEMERRKCSCRIKCENALEQPGEWIEQRHKGITLAWFVPSYNCLATLIVHLALSVTE